MKKAAPAGPLLAVSPSDCEPPLHQDNAQQKAQTEDKGYCDIVQETPAIPIVDESLPAVHEEG